MASFFTNFCTFIIPTYINAYVCVCPYLLLIVCLFYFAYMFFKDDHCIQDNQLVFFPWGKPSLHAHQSLVVCNPLVRLSPQKLSSTYIIYFSYIHYALFHFDSFWCSPSNFLLTLFLFILLFTGIYTY